MEKMKKLLPLFTLFTFVILCSCSKDDGSSNDCKSGKDDDTGIIASDYYYIKCIWGGSYTLGSSTTPTPDGLHSCNFYAYYIGDDIPTPLTPSGSLFSYYLYKIPKDKSIKLLFKGSFGNNMSFSDWVYIVPPDFHIHNAYEYYVSFESRWKFGFPDGGDSFKDTNIIPRIKAINIEF